MSTPRPLAVTALVKGAMIGMETCVNDATGDEIISACFTLTQRVIEAVVSTHPECRQTVQDAVESLLLACTDPTHTN